MGMRVKAFNNSSYGESPNELTISIDIWGREKARELSDRGSLNENVIICLEIMSIIYMDLDRRLVSIIMYSITIVKL